MNEKHQSAATTVISLFSPLAVCLNEGASQSRGDILAPVEIEEVLMELILEELRTFGTTMSIVNAEPLGILFQVDGDLIFITLSVEAFMSDGSVGLEMRGKASTNGLRQFGDLS